MALTCFFNCYVDFTANHLITYYFRQRTHKGQRYKATFQIIFHHLNRMIRLAMSRQTTLFTLTFRAFMIPLPPLASANVTVSQIVLEVDHVDEEPV